MQRYCQRPLLSKDQHAWQACYQQLIDHALAQPQVGVHRDYHSQNLMVQNDGQLGILDFQDSAIGPISYDVVSLLKDCYINWPRAQSHAWSQQYFQDVIHQHWPMSADAWQHSIECMGLQRHIKALGTFARKCLRDQAWQYEGALIRTQEYIKNVLPDYPQFHMIQAWMNSAPHNKP